MRVGLRSEAFDPTVPLGLVARQSPSAGIVVAKGTPVDYVISKGPEPIAVADPIADTDPHADTDSHADADADTDPHAHADSDADADADADADGHAGRRP